MAIAYRTILSAEPDSKTALSLISLVEDWLEGKGCKRGFEGTYFSGSTKFSYFHIERDDFSAMRWQLDEIWQLSSKYQAMDDSKRHGLSTVTLVKSKSATWFWVDVDSPNGTWTRADGSKVSGPIETETPKIVREVVQRIQVSDGSLKVNPSPEIVYNETQLRDLLVALEDDSRSSAILISTPQLGISEGDWASDISQISNGLRGLAVPFVLTQAMSLKFFELVGFKHAVQPGTMRTFLPGVRFHDSVDAYKHKLLHSNKLQADNFRFLSKVLFSAQINRLASTRLPAILLDADQLLSKLLKFEGRNSVVGEKTSAPEVPKVELEGKQALEVRGLPRTEIALLENLRTELSFWKQIAQEFADENGDLKRSIEEGKAAEHLLNEMIDDSASAALDRIRQDDLILRLRKELTALGSLDAYVLGVTDSVDTQIPESAEELISSIDKFEHLQFLGNRDAALALDDAPDLFPGLVRVWETLLALNSYGERKVAATFSGGLREYMESPNHDGRKVSGIKWRESESVLTNPRLEKQRRVQVPVSLDESGILTFVAHIAFSGKNQNYPRMYFFDGMNSDFGKIAIGYIGEHLDNTLTN